MCQLRLWTAERGLGGPMSLPWSYSRWTKPTYIIKTNLHNHQHLQGRRRRRRGERSQVISMIDKTQTRSGVCAAFLLHTLLTSATPDTCHEHTLNTTNDLHNHVYTPGPRLGHIPITSEIRLDFWLCASYGASKSTLLVRQKHVHNPL